MPICKGRDSEEVGNYRPISVLPATSKLLERLVANRCIRFLNTFNFFYELQFGFHKNHSIKLAVRELVNCMHQEIEKKNVIDLKKAFDTVNHKLLCTKLK